ncbi:phospho-N-acetylmuramoyl-pentapeptide-transferase [Candidatus Peregrinibacteria bacterium]|nr:phospho-N-acetylmuramoyl-pentapeptide-transferase [Candidatus Peregrinibacteria bacterium]
MFISDTIRHLILIFGSFLLAFISGFFLAKPFIQLLIHKKMTKNIREDATGGGKAPLFRQLHLKKTGTPTMGGILIWGISILIILFSRVLSYIGIFEHSLLNRKETYLPVATLLVTALLGAIDDFLNIKGKNNGLSAKFKFFWLSLFGLAGGLWFHYKLNYDLIHIPLIGDLPIGLWYIPLFAFVIVASANAVNITDGLDGLSGGLIVMAFAIFGSIAFAKGLFILSAFCAVLIGATLAFLWYNIPPALFYMGDTGSLALGATLGVIAMLTNSVVILPIIGIIFVIETLSVIIQLFSKKYFKKKVFHIAPLHHHFEYIGWNNATITMRFWFIGGIFGALGLILALISVQI